MIIADKTFFCLVVVLAAILLGAVSDDGQPDLSSEEVAAALAGMPATERECVTQRLLTRAERGIAPKQSAIDRLHARCKRQEAEGAKKKAAVQVVDEAVQSLRERDNADATKEAP